MRRALVFIFLVAGVLPFLGAAQRAGDSEQTGALSGRVSDIQSAALVGVEVTVDGASLREPLMVETDSEGKFGIEGLKPGTYNLTAELLGYNTVAQDGIPVEAGKVIELQITMTSL